MQLLLLSLFRREHRDSCLLALMPVKLKRYDLFSSCKNTFTHRYHFCNIFSYLHIHFIKYDIIQISERNMKYYKWKMAVSKSLDWEINSHVITKNCIGRNASEAYFFLFFKHAVVYLIASGLEYRQAKFTLSHPSSKFLQIDSPLYQNISYVFGSKVHIICFTDSNYKRMLNMIPGGMFLMTSFGLLLLSEYFAQ